MKPSGVYTQQCVFVGCVRLLSLVVSGTVNFCRPQIRTLLAITLAAAEAAVVAVSFFQIFQSTAVPGFAAAAAAAVSAAVSFAAADSVAAGLAAPEGSPAVLR